ncbi:hypothetical protein [Zooshikella ganghwensis]|uniref:hypothetical protein n=1 Tax=Zooshikella ganghwensis TaxID=202772 RepID=UPI001E3ECC8E|nr:hypothetical protein [Zooshikella ganghwensis]
MQYQTMRPRTYSPNQCSINNPSGGTYRLVDPYTGQVMRTGRTNNMNRREYEHGRDPNLRRYEFHPDVWTDSYSQQRGREQQIHELHNPPLNRVNPISPTNPRRELYMNSANTPATSGE